MCGEAKKLERGVSTAHKIERNALNCSKALLELGIVEDVVDETEEAAAGCHHDLEGLVRMERAGGKKGEISEEEDER